MEFGFFKGLPYGDCCNEDFDRYRGFKNKLSREGIIKHIESVELGLTSEPSCEIFTGEEIQAGMYWDGDFTFPYEFLHYYKNYDIGIPPEYEAYLKEQGVK